MLHRIRKHNQTSNVLREPILMVHGIMLTSGDWILLGPDKALSYLLIDNGYDVWLGNSRGNTYSMDHNTLDPLKREFWNFSFHEMGYYDLPAMIDYILNVTNHTKLFYVGHSQGTTQLLVLLSTRPEYNEKILEAHLLCPVSFCKHVPHPLATIFADNFDGIVAATGAFNFGTVPKIMKFLIQICANPVTIVFCYPWLNSIVGFNKNFENYIEPVITLNL